MIKIPLLFFAMLLFITFSVQAQAVEVTTADGNGADTYLSNDQQGGHPEFHPDSTHGDEEVMKLRNLPATRLKIPYLRFDVSSIKSPGIEIDSARIALWPTAYKGDHFPVIYVYALLTDDFDNWDEMTTSFNTAPGFMPLMPWGLFELLSDMVLVDSMIVNDTLVAPGTQWREGIAYFHSEGSDAMDDFINNYDTNGLLTFTFIGKDADVIDHDFDIGTKEDPEPHVPKLIFNTIVVGIDDNNEAVISDYKLNQNYPNPFNPVTTIEFTLEKTGHTTLEIYNTLGQLVTTLIDGQMSGGQHQISFSAENYPSGIYFYKLTSGNFSEMKKMMFLK